MGLAWGTRMKVIFTLALLEIVTRKPAGVVVFGVVLFVFSPKME